MSETVDERRRRVAKALAKAGLCSWSDVYEPWKQDCLSKADRVMLYLPDLLASDLKPAPAREQNPSNDMASDKRCPYGSREG